MFTALEFFAGSGLVRLGLSPDIETVWANDNCEKKRETYVENHSAREFKLAKIQDLKAVDLPSADLAWASFPCQDLSLAGNLGGMIRGTRSGLFWEWVRLLKELNDSAKRPTVLVAENVVGFVVSDQGKHFRDAYFALRDLGYRVGALVINASEFVPQSRARAFIVAVSEEVPIGHLSQVGPSAPFHSAALIRVAASLDRDWIWWTLPAPPVRRLSFQDVCERSGGWDTAAKTAEICAMLSPLNQRKLEKARESKVFFAGTAYRRTRPDENGKKVQRLEIRFDGLAGCLRTPDGGSSRQIIIVVENGIVRSRLLSPRECARLMGAPDNYKLMGSYNDCYRAMGDAVAVPVTRWLTSNLLRPLLEANKHLQADHDERLAAQVSTLSPAIMENVGSHA